MIGAGVSGMSAAWHLHRYGYAVKVFERNDRIGGNAYTVDVVVGDEERWVDLGVNDFNAKTYSRLVGVFDQLGVKYRRLDDTACFATLDGSICYTTDGKSGTQMPGPIRRDAERFQREAPEVLTNPRYRYMLVGEYVAEKGYCDEFVSQNLYPRINGMYFADWQGAGSAPVWPVVKYYTLQEGLNPDVPPKPERMYFVNGSREWMAKLHSAAQQRFPVALNAEASVHAGPDGVVVQTFDRSERFDKVVLAQQAEDALRSFRAGLTTEVARFLDSFEYYDDEVVVHNYFGALPPDVGTWRTYNILIRRNASGIRPYTITYVANRHQNDAQNPRYGRSGTPLFFVTLNPAVPIPDAHILRRSDGTPAKAVFRDIAHTVSTVKAQERRQGLQGINNVFLTGGYACGAGLHEECWTDGMRLAEYIYRTDTNDAQGSPRSPEPTHPRSVTW